MGLETFGSPLRLNEVLIRTGEISMATTPSFSDVGIVQSTTFGIALTSRFKTPIRPELTGPSLLLGCQPGKKMLAAISKRLLSRIARSQIKV